MYMKDAMYLMKHPRKSSCSVRAARETKNTYLVTDDICVGAQSEYDYLTEKRAHDLQFCIRNWYPSAAQKYKI